VLVVLANAMPGTDDDFSRWYEEVHIPDLLLVPGVVSAKRFRLTENQMRGVKTRPYEYMVIYQLESGDPKAVVDEIVSRLRGGQIAVSPTLDVARTLNLLFAQTGETVGG
jgi:hypothetical protein